MERRDGAHQDVKQAGGKKTSPKESRQHKSAFMSETAALFPVSLSEGRQGVKVGKGEWPYKPGPVSHKVTGKANKRGRMSSSY